MYHTFLLDCMVFNVKNARSSSVFNTFTNAKRFLLFGWPIIFRTLYTFTFFSFVCCWTIFDTNVLEILFLVSFFYNGFRFIINCFSMWFCFFFLCALFSHSIINLDPIGFYVLEESNNSILFPNIKNLFFLLLIKSYILFFQLVHVILLVLDGFLFSGNDCTTYFILFLNLI